MENQIREFTKKGNRRRLLKRVVSLLCVVVLLFTMNTLKRNANTLERIAMCGLQEHTHTAGCYNSSGELVCAIPEHVHTDACYQQSPSDELVLNGDDLEIADGLVDAGDTQSLDLSLDLDQGDLLDFVQDSDAPASNVQDIGNDMPVLDGDLVFDTSYNNEDTQQLAANTSVEEAQGAVDETQSEEAHQLLEEEQIAVEDGQDQPTGEGQEQISFEEDQEQPVEQPTEAAQEQPVEEETEQPVEEEQEQPVEEETEQPVEEETEQPVEGEQLVEEDQDQIAIEEQPVVAEQEQPVEEVQEQLVIEEQEEPVVEAQEEPVVEEQEEPVVEEQEETVIEEQEEPVVEEQEEPAVEEQEETVVEEQEEPAVEEQEEPVVEEQEEPAVEEQEEPVVEEQEEPVVEEQEEPVVEEQEETVVEEQEEPAIEEQEEPVVEEQEETVVEEQEEPAIEEQEEPVVEEQEEPVVEEQEEPVVEEQEEPAVEEQEQPAIEEQEESAVEEQEEPAVEEQEEPAIEEQEEPAVEEQEELAVEEQEGPAVEEQEEPAVEEQEEPAVEEQEEPAVEEQEQPAIEEQEEPAEEAEQPAEEAEQPTEEEAEQPTEEEAEQPAEEEAEQPAEEEAEQPAEENAEQAAEEEAEQPAEEEAEQPAEEEQEQPAEEEAEQPTEEEAEQPAEEEQEQPAEEAEPEAEGEPEEEPEAQIAYPAKQFQQGTAYINVSVDAPEGAFPEGTVMVVKDVEDQGTIDNIQQSVAEDFVEVTSVHAVDISFWYNDAEIEPLLPIAVVMSAVEAPNADQAQETVVVHVDDNGETQLVDSEATGAAEAALEMPAAADAEAQAFEADTFSVYALVTKQVIETKYIDDHGDTWRIKVDYGKDAKLPEGASLQVAEVTDETYLAQAEAALETGKRITKARFFDIRIMDGDCEVQPDDQVKVTITLEGDEGEIEATENQNDIGNPDVVAMHFVEQDDEIVSVEKQSAVETDEGVVFHADGFSAWGVVYTVDFTYVDRQGAINLDFTGFDATSTPEDASLVYNTTECNVHVALSTLESIIQGIGSEDSADESEQNTGLIEDTVEYSAEFDTHFTFDTSAAEKVEATGGVDFVDGELVITADGSVDLTDGENSLHINIGGLSALKEELLEAEGVSIEVIEGNVPLGSEASYEAHTEAETTAIVNEYLTDDLTIEDGGENYGYSAADLKIVRNDEALPVEGLFQVTVDKQSLVPAGMKLEKLYHIHDGKVEELAVEETSAGLTFETTGFSDIVAFYSGNNSDSFTMTVGSEVLLSQILNELQLQHYVSDGEGGTVTQTVGVDDVTAVSFSGITYGDSSDVDASTVFTVTEVSQSDNPVQVDGGDVNISTAHDYKIENLQRFDNATMTLTVDGADTAINVRCRYELDDNGELAPHTTTVRFFDVNSVYHNDAQNPYTTGEETVPDPALQSNYYILATYDKVINYNTGDSETVRCWAVEPIELKDLTDTNASVQFTDFRSTDPDDTRVYQRTDTDIYNITTRLYRSDTLIGADQFTYTENDQGQMVLGNTVGATLTDSMESGYQFGGGTYDGVGHSNEIHIRNTNNNYKYKVRLRFSPGSTAAITGVGDDESTDQQNLRYYVLVRVTHRTGDPTYAWANIEGSVPSAVDDDGYYYKDFELPDPTDGWMTWNNSATNDQFTGHEQRIEVFLVKSNYGPPNFDPSQFFQTSNIENNISVIFQEAEDFNSYVVHYDTRDSRGSNKYYTETVGDTVWCYDRIDLTSKNVTAEYDYTTILGPNVVYGIVAEHLYQPNHLQTNFAVNHFSGHGHDVRPDLSGSYSGNIVIGEFNISDGSKRNSVGDVADDPTWGRLKVGKPLNGTLLVYADNDSGYFETDENGNKVLASVYDNPGQTIVVPTDGSSLSQNIVEPGIEYGKRMSNILASKTASFRPTLTGGNKITINTQAFDEYATIYLDGDLLKDYIETSGGLTIEKNDHQTIVFNFTDRVNTKSITINQFVVNQPSFANYGYPNGYKTESPEATGSDQNKVMDDIARHIVWNLAACTNKVTIDTAGGIFLQPNDDSEIEIKGTTAGWIVSDGYVYNGTAEWHNVYEEMPDFVEVNLFALKYLDGKMPSQNKKYTFQLDKLAFSYDNITGLISNPHWESMETVENNYFTASFTPIRQDQMHLGWNIFRITETGKATGTEGAYITDNTVYYAAVYMEEIVVAEQRVNNIRYTVTMPRYYTACDIDEFDPYLTSDRKPNPEITGVYGARSVIPVFENETITTGLTLMKKVNGTTATNKPFVFGIELWKGEDNVKTALTDAERGLLNINGGVWTTAPSTVDDHTYAEVTLKNGRRVTITGLGEDVKYKITEIKIGDKVITDPNNLNELGYIDGYKPVTVNEEDGTYSISGEIEDTDIAYSETFVNEYKASGDVELDISKVLKQDSAEGEGIALIADQFAFTISGGGRTPVTGYNLATDPDTGKAVVEFPINQGNVKLTFTQDDMADAKRDEDGYLVKEVTLLLHESRGKLTQAQIDAYNENRDPAFDYDNVVYDDDREITLVLTDKGDGTIEVTPKNSTSDHISFTNILKKKAEAELEAVKTMEGRAMNRAEFIFNAKLISVDSVDVSSAALNATGITDEQLAQLLALRRQTSPVDVIGSNQKVTAPTEEGGTTYTGNVTFPKIRYTEPGTYVYEITEDTSSMPVDAKQQENSIIRYRATVTVNQDMETTVTYSKVEVTGEGNEAVETVTSLGEDVKPEFKNETKKISFEVTKLWLDKDGDPVTGEKYITFTLKRDGNVNITGNYLSGQDKDPVVSRVTNKAGCNGTVEVVGDTVKLTCDTDGNWPTAVFTDMDAGRYVITEVGHSAVTGSLTTTYTQPNPNDATAVISTSIVRDGETLTITNKESQDTYTNITVHKVWKAGETEYVPTSGSATFELWESKVMGSSGSGSNVITFRDQNGNVATGVKKDTITVKYTINRGTYSDLISFYSNLSSYYLNDIYACESFDQSGNMSANRETISGPIRPKKPEAISGDQTAIMAAVPDTGNYTVELEFDIPVPQDLAFEVSAIRASINNFSSSCPVSILSGVDSKVRTFTLSNTNSWSWSSGTLPLSKNNGAVTWSYYIKEINVPDHFTVSYSTSGTTITATNTQSDTVSKKVKKAWDPAPEAGTTITLGLFAGDSEATAAASTTPMYTVVLNGTPEAAEASEGVETFATAGNTANNYESPAWQANFTNLPKYGADGTELVYIVKETAEAEGYTVKYNEAGTAEYVLASASTMADADTSTITNEQIGTGDLTITKREVDATHMLGNEPRTYRIAVKNSEGTYYNTQGQPILNQDSTPATEPGESGWVEFTLPSENEANYTKTWSNLPSGVYAIEEEEVSVTDGLWTVSGLNNVQVTNDDTVRREVVNTFDTLATDVPVTKTWSGDISGDWSATFALKVSKRLYAVDGVLKMWSSEAVGWTAFTAVTEADPITGRQQPVTLTIDNNTPVAERVFANRPKYEINQTTGLVYELKYTADETAYTTGDGKVYTVDSITEATRQADGTFSAITATNTPDDTKTKVQVEKIWGDGNANHSGDTVRLQLVRYKMGAPKYTLNIAHAADGALSELPSGFSATYTVKDSTDVTVESDNGVYRVIPGTYYVYCTVNDARAPEGYNATTASPVEVVVGNSAATATVTTTYTDNREYGVITIAHVASGLDSTTLPSGFAATYAINGPTTVNNAVPGQQYTVLAGSYTVTASVTNGAAPTGFTYNTTTASAEVSISSSNTSSAPATASFTSSYTDNREYGYIRIAHISSGLDDSPALPNGFAATYSIAGTASGLSSYSNVSAGTYRVLVGEYNVTANVTNSAAPSGKAYSSESSTNTATVTVTTAATENTPVDATLTSAYEESSSNETITIIAHVDTENVQNEYYGVQLLAAHTASYSIQNLNWSLETITKDTEKTSSITLNKYDEIGNPYVWQFSVQAYNYGTIDLNCSATGVTLGTDKVVTLDGATGNIDLYISVATQSAFLFNPFVAYAEEDIRTISQLINMDYGVDNSFSEYIDLSSANDWSELISGLDVYDEYGQPYYYGILEPSVPDGYTVSCSDPISAVSLRDEGQTITLTATNTPQRGHISVTKTDVKDVDTGAHIDADNTFAFTIKGQGSDTVLETLTVQKGETATSGDLELGKTYVVEETTTGRDINGYTFTRVDMSAATVTLTSADTVAVTATNYYDKDERFDTVPDSVTVNKLDENNTALPGATFKLYSNNDNGALSGEVATYTASSFTIATGDLTAYLPAVHGDSVTLYLKETVAPTGYVLDDTIHNVVITTTVSGPTYVATAKKWVTTTTYTMTIDGLEAKDIPNTPDTDTAREDGSVKVYKTDGTNPLAGAIFKLYDGETEVDTYYGADATDYTISTADAELANVLPAVGATKTLTLKETAAPEGYIKSDVEYTVSISASQATDWNNDHTKLVTTTTYAITIDGGASATVPNTPQTGSVTFTQVKTFKNGAAATAFGYTVTEYTDDTYETEKSVITNTGSMSVATSGTTTVNYTLADVGDHYYGVKENLPAGTTPTATDIANGYIIVDHIKYDLKEHRYAVNVSIGTNALVVKKVVDDTQTIITAIDSNFTNEQLGDLHVTKTVQKNGTTDTSATGTFYYAVYSEEYNASADPAQVPVRTGSITIGSGDDGTRTATESDLSFGTYYVYELDGAAGTPIVSGNDSVKKAIDNMVYTVTGSGTSATVNATAGTATLTNNHETIDLEVNKAWAPATSWPRDVTSVTVQLYSKVGNADATPIAGKTLTITPENSAATAATVEAAEGDEAKAAQQTLLDQRFFKDLPKYDGDGNLITYSVVETAVTGTNVSVDDFTITYSPAETTGGGLITITNTQKPISIKVIKVEKGTSIKLPNAEFQLTKKNSGGTYEVFENEQFAENKETKKKTGPFSVGSSGEITINNLLPGDYKLRETKAPAGYIIATGDIEFTINVDGTVTVGERTADDAGNITYTDNMVTFAQKTASAAASVTVQNEPGVALPATGGVGTGFVYGAGAALLLLAVLGLILLNRKRTDGEGIR